MGNIASKTRLFIAAILSLRKTYDELDKRIQAPPGIPVSNPTLPFWTVPPTTIPSGDGGLPEHADVVIIGSGITGASVAYSLLERNSGVKVLMLEARDVCSGATGRNGGHINPPLYHDYSQLKEKFGEDAAKQTIRFRLAHLKEMKRIADDEDILKESQFRDTEHLDVFTCPDTYAKAKENLAKWKTDMPEEAGSFGFCDKTEAIERFRLSDETVGCIYGAGGAIHPYRFVTSLLAKLVKRYPDSFQLVVHTPCTAIAAPRNTTPYYTVTTPRGTLTAPHVVHATNGWCSHLLEPMRAKIIPARGGMSAQRPGTLLHGSTLTGGRSFVFYRGGTGYDYLTQLPTGEHELMFGGGWAQSCDGGLPDIAITDDAVVNFPVAAHLAGALPLYFGLENWGSEVVPSGEQDARWGTGRTKATWSGVLGISTDALPWVGRLPAKVSGRAEPPPNAKERAQAGLAAPGEWLAAGYSGEGMVHAWMSGRAVAQMLLDREEEVRAWFPDILRVTEQRWKRARVDDLLARFV
ncbi:FAD dependent oxidoreductase [Laetiporus sulphureus 93-53]|uniref:FAD dependent oxidoreductase n=1 Tax=Laetiporus sulphureus 93-53 TaxID=1314785 RepID=A0A165FIG0_9APHY|nr:FAD dependent oxidoreductase [Laetiporus sulphureus 93-53]KZT09018.1 FAD dependent oxidoreductase [Laetiporus sulphureus 93-53]